MAMPEICTVAECVAYMSAGDSITTAQRSLLEFIKNATEADARSFCRHNITQPTTPYVHFLPDRRMSSLDAPLIMAEVYGNKVVGVTEVTHGEALQCPQAFLRSIAEIRADYLGYAGDRSGSFDSTTIITSGVDYFIDWDEVGLCRSGIVYRTGPNWPPLPRSVKCTYTSGFTAAELDAEYNFVKFAVIEETVMRFKLAKTRQGTGSDGVYPVKSESFGQEYSVTYSDAAQKYYPGSLSAECAVRLERIQSVYQ